uniref:Uncharacterized protein n=1 Tax=Triticum urartu TaxID=4572 RepID=A0A8R7PXG4_TRIUA
MYPPSSDAYRTMAALATADGWRDWIRSTGSLSQPCTAVCSEWQPSRH